MRPRFFIPLIVTVLILSACAGGGSAVDATATPAPTETPVLPPTLTATPTVPLAILVLPADMAVEVSDLYQKTVYDLAQASGMRFQVRNNLTTTDLEPGLKIVIVLLTDPGISALAAAAPDVQFLAINITGVVAGGNISVLGGNSQSDIASFLAGYTAAMVTDDYRIGMLMPKGNNDAIRMFNAYANGMKFYCGFCRPFYYLPWSFPQYLEIPAEEDENNYDAFADILILQFKVRTLFIHPDIDTQDLVDYIGTTGVSMIGTVTPEQRPAGWIMTIQPDTVRAIQTAWPQLLSGQGGITVQSPLGLSDIDPDLLSPGKQRLVQKTLDDLQAGYIAP
ncbi:MAG TPA: hypothetical protein VLT51_08015 [Anaerolineales bacterium]|nr:hypothetical protein [Anaerolineales bacterium]